MKNKKMKMHQQAGVSFEYKFPFKQRKKQKKLVKGKRPQSKPKHKELSAIGKLLALAYHYQKLLEDGLIKDYTELAIQTNVSKARISQIVNLLFLAPEIQKNIINADIDKLITERQIRKIAGITLWDEQIKKYNC